jgi:D-inositol-3-phosphate glycosyltransferase
MMNSLVFSSIPEIIEKEKDIRRDKVSLGGASVVQADLVQSLLTYGTYDNYYFLSSLNPVDSKQRLSAYQNSERGQIISYGDLSRLKGIDRMIMLKGRMYIRELLDIRRFHGRSTWPVVGIIHALSYSGMLPHALVTYLENKRPYDSLICTSRVGRRVLEQMFSGFSKGLEERLGVPVAYQARLPVIPLGTDTETFRPRDQAEARRGLGIQPDATVFLYLGRISMIDKMDPFPLLLTFCKGVAKTNSRALLIVAGDDTQQNLMGTLKEFAKGLGAAERVIFLPNVKSEDKLLLYSAADVFVSLSDTVQETFGLTIIEAMASGLPVIASDWSGYKESVLHNETGFLAPTYWGRCVDEVSSSALVRGDQAAHWILAQSLSVDLKSLNESMVALAGNAELRRQMGAKARQRAVECYSWPVIIRKYEELWRELLTEAAACTEEKRIEGHGISSFDYLNMFGHYATNIIDEDARVKITSHGRNFLDKELELTPLNHDLRSFSQKLNYQIASVCEREGELKIVDLIKSLGNGSGLSREIIFQHVMRLMKYGVLELQHTDVRCSSEQSPD